MTAKPIDASRPKLVVYLSQFREVGIVAFIFALIILVSLRTPNFLTFSNFEDILMNISILMIVAFAQAMIIITRGIDLSVSSIIALTAMMVSVVVKTYPTFSPVAAVFLGMALGSVLGMVNGLIIAYGKVPPIIATLGSISIYRGLVFLYGNGTWVNSFEMSKSFKMISKGTPLGIPNLVIIALVAAGLAYYFWNYTRTGRDIFSVGSNPDAAPYAGIRKERIIFLVYVISGIASGLAGVLWASRFESAQTNTAAGFELQTVAASVIGGVSTAGGAGTVPGVMLGALLLGIIQNALTLVKISPFWQQAVQGALILIAVISDHYILRAMQRKNK